MNSPLGISDIVAPAVAEANAVMRQAAREIESLRSEVRRLNRRTDSYRTENGKYERTMRAARDLLKADEFDTARDLIDAFLRGIDGPSD